MIARWRRGQRDWTAWDAAMLLAFIPGSAFWAMIAIVQPTGVGSHANIYTGAAAEWLSGGNPWTFGPPAAVFAGPPSMLLPFAPFVGLPIDATRLVWFVMDLAVAALVIRRLGMPSYWLLFPPLFAAIILGHIEVLVLGLLVLRGPLSGLAAIVKPYAALPLVAERRWKALALAAIVAVVTFPILPWAQLVTQAGSVSQTLARQNVGDGVFGDAVLMAVGVVALVALGVRRALWLAVPVLWPYAQPIYKTMTMPVLTPVLAIAWALPVPGATLLGIVVLGALVTVDRVRPLPGWLKAGIEPAARTEKQRWALPDTRRTLRTPRSDSGQPGQPVVA